MSKGGKTQTVTQDSTPWNSTYLSGLFNTAQDLYTNNKVPYYSGSTYYVDPNLSSGYTGLSQTSQYDQANIVPKADYMFGQAADGKMGGAYSPAYAGLLDSGAGNLASQQSTQGAGASLDYYGLGGGTYNSALSSNAQGAISGNKGLGYLEDTASGKYLGANPNLDNMYNAAADAVTRKYQTATAPDTDSRYELAGRYGSGAMANERSQNRLDLGQSLSNLSSDIYGKDYQTERGLMNDAAANLATGYTGATNASTTAANSGLDSNITALKGAGALSSAVTDSQNTADKTLQEGYDTGNQNSLRGLSLYPSVLQGDAYPAQTMVDAGKGLTTVGQGYLNDARDRYYGDALAPWEDANRYSALLGNPITGTSTTTSPLYSNSAASLLGTGLAGTSILGQTGAFGSSGWLSNLWGGSGTSAATSSLFDGISADALDSLLGLGTAAL